MKYLGQKTNNLDIATKSDLVGKQDVLPTTSVAGKVLTSTSTSGTVQWADATKVTFVRWS